MSIIYTFCGRDSPESGVDLAHARAMTCLPQPRLLRNHKSRSSTPVHPDATISTGQETNERRTGSHRRTERLMRVHDRSINVCFHTTSTPNPDTNPLPTVEPFNRCLSQSPAVSSSQPSHPICTPRQTQHCTDSNSPSPPSP